MQSDLFRGDERLERRAVNHADHVTPGSRGDFVSKIQEALVILDGAIITGSDVNDQTYGPSTADALLAYQTARDVVNRAYQTTPENIVGIMIINRMDTEMAEKEAQMPDMIERARLGAFHRTFAAFVQVTGIGPRPLGGCGTRTHLNGLRRGRDPSDTGSHRGPFVPPRLRRRVVCVSQERSERKRYASWKGLLLQG